MTNAIITRNNCIICIICIIQIFEYFRVFNLHYSKYLSIPLEPALYYSHRLDSTCIMPRIELSEASKSFFYIRSCLVLTVYPKKSIKCLLASKLYGYVRPKPLMSVGMLKSLHTKYFWKCAQHSPRCQKATITSCLSQLTFSFILNNVEQ